MIADPLSEDGRLRRGRRRRERVRRRPPTGDAHLRAGARHQRLAVVGVGHAHATEAAPEAALSVANGPDEFAARSSHGAVEGVHSAREAGHDSGARTASRPRAGQVREPPVVVEEVLPAGYEPVGVLAGRGHAHPLGARRGHHVAVGGGTHAVAEPRVVRLPRGQVDVAHPAVRELAHAVARARGAHRVHHRVGRRGYHVGARVARHVHGQGHHVGASVRHDGPVGGRHDIHVVAGVDGRCPVVVVAHGGGGGTRAHEERHDEAEHSVLHGRFSDLVPEIRRARWIERCGGLMPCLERRDSSIPFVPRVKQFFSILSIPSRHIDSKNPSIYKGIEGSKKGIWTDRAVAETILVRSFRGFAR